MSQPAVTSYFTVIHPVSDAFYSLSCFPYLYDSESAIASLETRTLRERSALVSAVSRGPSNVHPESMPPLHPWLT